MRTGSRNFRVGLTLALSGMLMVGAACTPDPPPAPTKDCTVRAPGADLRGCDLSAQIFAGQEQPESSGNYVVMDLSGADLRDTLLDESGFYSGVDFTGANFANAKLLGVNVAENAGVFGTVKFTNNDFTNADLTGASFDAAGFYDGIFAGAILKDLSLYEGGLSGTFAGADLSGSTFLSMSSLSGDLQGVNLRGVKWVGLSSLGGDLRDADLATAEFSWSVLSGNAAGANLSEAVFDRADVIGADLTGADLSGATFTAVNFDGVDFTNANLTGALFLSDPVDGPNVFNNVTWSNTTCPDGTVRSTPCV